MSKARLLLVEDEAVVAADLQDRLTAHGYEVAGWAASGEEAIHLTGSQQIDLVLMDIILSGELGGTETAARLRQQYDLPVIYLTANSNAAVLERAKCTEPFGFVLKPFDDRELILCIELALYRSRKERERRELTRRLERALVEAGALCGPLPLCAWCHKVRNEHGSWESFEDCISNHTLARISHGICPECTRKLEEEGGLPPPESPADG